MGRTRLTVTPISIGLAIFLGKFSWNGPSTTSGCIKLMAFLRLTCIGRLLDLLFKFITCWCLRIVPPLFLRDMYRALIGPPSQPPPKTPHYSPMLHNALIALATAFSDDPRIRDLNSRQFFARKAKSYIEAECQRPNISVVHALSIIGSFHSSQGDQTLGYMYFGEFSTLKLLYTNILLIVLIKAWLVEYHKLVTPFFPNFDLGTHDLILVFL
jgi:hypothetical protein